MINACSRPLFRLMAGCSLVTHQDHWSLHSDSLLCRPPSCRVDIWACIYTYIYIYLYVHIHGTCPTGGALPGKQAVPAVRRPRETHWASWGGRSGSGRAAPLLGDALGVLGGEAVSLFQGKSMPSSPCFGAWFSHPPGSQVGSWCVPGLTRPVTPCSGEVIYTEARAGGSAMMSVQGKSAQMSPDRELKAEHKHDGAARHA